MNKGLSAKNEKRINEVYSLICQGLRSYEIVDYCIKNFGVKKRRAEFYITEARKKIKELTKLNIEDLRNEAIARYNEIYRLVMQEKDYKTAVYVLSRIDKINALETFNFKHEISDVSDKIKEILQKRMVN